MDLVWGGTEEDWTEQCLVCVEGGEVGPRRLWLTVTGFRDDWACDVLRFG